MWICDVETGSKSVMEKTLKGCFETRARLLENAMKRDDFAAVTLHYFAFRSHLFI